MVKVSTDAPVCRRIARSFLDFLDSVEPAQWVDHEALEVARECLAEAFKLNSGSSDDRRESDSLIDIFSSLEERETQNEKPDPVNRESSAETTISSSTSNNAGASISVTAPKAMEDDLKGESHSIGILKDELFGQFFGALEKIHFFRSAWDGNDDPALLDKATCIFHDGLSEMERSGCQSYDVKSLAEALKSLGNKAMQSKLYSDAIELYSFAIALCGDNAVFYCNRAAAYTQINKCTEAIKDCLKSIEIDPNYSKAYSRLGLAYYAQGNYGDAIEKGFNRALELDPNNESVKENIKVAEQKLREQQQRAGWYQSSGAGNSQEPQTQSRSPGSPPQFSMPFNAEGLPPNLASVFMNVTGNMFQGQASQTNQWDNGDTDALDGALRSVMQMFAGASPSPPQGNNTSHSSDSNQNFNDNNHDPSSGRSG